MPKININSLDLDSENEVPKSKGKKAPKKMKPKEEGDKKNIKK